MQGLLNRMAWRIGNNVSPMKNQKRPFYDFYMKFMMYLDYSIWKFPIPRLREGGKQGGKLSHWLYKPKFLPFIPSRLRGRGGRASDFQSIGRRFDPWWRANFFFPFFYLIILENFVIFLYQSITIATIILWKLSKTNILQALQLYCK